RRIVGFARNVSLISEEEYAALEAPSSIQWFPGDLSNKKFEYCGIYEDGWVAESSYAMLKQPEGPSTLTVSLSVPALHGKPSSSWAALVLDGREISRQSASSGSISFRVPVQGGGRRRVELLFDRAV